MKPRPPTMRNKRRYILARIDPPYPEPDQREIFQALAEAIASLYGDLGASKIQAAVISCGGGYTIVRCTRGTEGMLLAAMSTVTRVREDRLALRSCLASGTLLALRRAVQESPAPAVQEEREVQFSGRMFQSVRYHGEKVDLVEKGFKSQERLFLTREDLEDY